VKLALVPEEGLPPVAVHANVTGEVPPDDVAEQETTTLTVPVAGQFIETANA